MFLFYLITSTLVLAGVVYLCIAVGPLEAKTRKEFERLYPKSTLISWARVRLIIAWLAGARRYTGASPVTVVVLYAMRTLIVVTSAVKVLLLFVH